MSANLLPPQAGDEKRAEDILDDIHTIFTRTNTRMRYTRPRFGIDGHPGIDSQRNGLGWLGVWMCLSQFNPETGRWNHTDRNPEMASFIVAAMLDVLRKHKAHMVYDLNERVFNRRPTHVWVLCAANELNEYRRIAELAQITPKRIEFRTFENEVAFRERTHV